MSLKNRAISKPNELFLFEILTSIHSSFAVDKSLAKLNEDKINRRINSINDPSTKLDLAKQLAEFNLGQTDAGVFFNPDLAVTYLNVLEKKLMGLNKSRCLTYLALAHTQLYKYHYHKNNTALAETNKQQALDYINNSQNFLTSRNESTPKIDLFKAINWCMEAEILFAETKPLKNNLYNLDSVMKLYKKAIAHLSHSNDAELKYYLTILKTRYAYFTTIQNQPEEKALDLFADLEKNHWPSLDKADQTSYIEMYAKILFQTGNPILSLEKYKMVAAMLTSQGNNSEKVDFLKVKISAIENLLPDQENIVPSKKTNNTEKTTFYSNPLNMVKKLFSPKNDSQSPKTLKSPSTAQNFLSDDKTSSEMQLLKSPNSKSPSNPYGTFNNDYDPDLIEKTTISQRKK